MPSQPLIDEHPWGVMSGFRARSERCGRARRRLKLRRSTSRASEDLPDPETPVTTVNLPTGIRASTPRRLCKSAPLISIMGVRRSTIRRRDLECCSGGGEAAARGGITQTRQFGGRSLGNDPAAARACTGTQIDDVIGAANGVLIVLDHHQRVALGAQSIQGIQQCDVIAGVQADRGLVQHIAHAPANSTRVARPAGCVALRRAESVGAARFNCR